MTIGDLHIRVIEGIQQSFNGLRLHFNDILLQLAVESMLSYDLFESVQNRI